MFAFYWFVLFMPSVSSLKHVIINLDPEEDYGNYSCVAENFLGSGSALILVSGKFNFEPDF